MYARFAAEIEQLNQQVLEQAGQRPTRPGLLLMTHPGVGPITALATDVFLGDPKQIQATAKLPAGELHRDHSTGTLQRRATAAGKALSKQGNPLLRFLWCEAAVHAVRRDP